VTQFEYITIAPTLILSFSLARALSNLSPIFVSQSRYWIHSIWVVILIANHLGIFFSYWFFHFNEDWSFGEFVFFLIHPVGLLITSALLIPSSEVADYRAHFETIRTPFYIVWIVTMASDPVLGYVVLGVPVTHPANLLSVFLVLAFLLGLTFRRRAVDGGLAVVISVFSVVFLTSLDQLAENVRPALQ
jgi:hypothetical protein